jgi:CRP-like cAMP-binding protein
MPQRHRLVARNRVLASLPSSIWARLSGILQPVALGFKEVRYTPGHPIEFVYFIQDGLVSIVSTQSDGTQIEVGIIGREGIIGHALVLDVDSSPHDAVVQVAGSALRMGAEEFTLAIHEYPELRHRLNHFVQAFHVQVAQTAACNGTHMLTSRLARWLLMASDRLGSDDIRLTHEFLAIMLGVRRPAVTVALGALERTGLIRCRRNHINIIDRKALITTCCECFGIVRSQYNLLTGEHKTFLRKC